MIRSITPGATTAIYSVKNGLLTSLVPIEKYAEVKGYFAKNKDFAIPYIIVNSPHVHMRSLLVVGYGAYGHSTNINTSRWVPLLRRGWGIVFAFVRGGGDHTMAWANAARTWRREASVADFECVVRAAQKETGISAKSTVVYGRSAGGILVGSAAARQVGISLFAGLYAEVPYLDVLRTTTNPDLPLTQLEYEEFGDPLRRIEDLVAIATISPMESIPEEGFPKLFALMRTGGNDREVLAYEPVKWILRARGKSQMDSTKLLAFEDNQGHFVDEVSGIENRAVDLGILLSWMR
jgi:oligopeptidase B